MRREGKGKVGMMCGVVACEGSVGFLSEWYFWKE